MWNVYAKEVGLFRGVTGVEQALVQKIMDTVEEAYLSDIPNSSTNSINDTLTGVLTYIQDNNNQCDAA